MHDAELVEHADGTEIQPDRNGTPEELSHLIRRSRGRQIPVEMRVAEQRVTYGPANAPRLEPGGFEPFRDSPNGPWGVYHWQLPPGRCGADPVVSFVLIPEPRFRSVL